MLWSGSIVGVKALENRRRILGRDRVGANDMPIKSGRPTCEVPISRSGVGIEEDDSVTERRVGCDVELESPSCAAGRSARSRR